MSVWPYVYDKDFFSEKPAAYKILSEKIRLHIVQTLLEVVMEIEPCFATV